ncbi:MAG TPA: hypothetical protein VMB26_00275 [Candidatus Binataceae bacterium]|nr:hypothetical protein [Candidatus Binataceae bacterium]
MKAHQIATFSAALFFAAGSMAWAGPIGISRPESLPKGTVYTLSDMQMAAAELRHDADTTKGSGRQLYLMETVGLDDLIARMQRGEPVTTAEVDAALGS